MTFGWQGFSFRHPADWAPVALSGNRREGYVRLGSSGRLSLQIRWKTLGREPNLDRFLRDYFGRLERDARKSKATFTSESVVEGSARAYRYRGATFGRGQLFVGECGRAFALEVASTQNDSVRGPLRMALDDFASGGETEVWSVLGLGMRLPAGLEMERRDFVSGRTRLWLRGRSVQVAGERWAFANELLKAHGMAEWARAVLGAERAEVVEEKPGLRLRWSEAPWKPKPQALVQYQAEANQLIVVTSRSRDPRWRPEWSWLREQDML